MLADESLRESARYMMDRIRTICEEFGPRRPGSEGEKRCQEFLRDELAGAGLGPVLEPFPVSQTAFMTAPMISGYLGLAAIPCFWISPILSTGLTLLAVMVFLSEIGFYRHILTPFFPQHTSYNLYAALAPSGAVKRRIILAGHADAACEWRYQERFPSVFFLCGLFAVGSVFCLFLISLITAVFHGLHAPTDGVWWYVGLGQFIALPGAFVAATFTRLNVVAPGAVDNLTGALMAVGLARQICKDALSLENTEVVFMVTGSEEAGLVGADAFARRHKDEWKDIETVFIAIESFRDLDYLMVYDRDMNGRIRHHPGVCALLQNAMKKCGIHHGLGCVTVGSTDAAATARLGIPSGALVGMDPTPAHYYHCRRDTWQILDEECLFKAAQVLTTALQDYDRNGLPT